MKAMQRTASAVTAALVFATAGTALGEDTAPLPQEQTQGSVRFLTGGVGTDEAKAVQKEIPRYPLALEFVGKTKPKNEFLADVAVTITDREGRIVLDTVSDGPYLLVKLEPGKYRIAAVQYGETKNRSVEVTAKGSKRVMFEWKADADA